MLSLPPAISTRLEIIRLASRRHIRWPLPPLRSPVKINVLKLSLPMALQLHREQPARLVKVNVPSRIVRRSVRSANAGISTFYFITAPNHFFFAFLIYGLYLQTC